jgi:rhamnosyltransferase
MGYRDASTSGAFVNRTRQIELFDGFSVAVVVVTFQPKLPVLKVTIQSLKNQVSHVYLVDNTPGGALNVIGTVLDELDCSPLVTTLILRDNVGLARAQNEGIKLAIADKCDFIMLSDQDTCYPPNSVKKLIDDITALQRKGVKVAALAPAFVNSHTPELSPYFLKLKGFFVKRIFVNSGLVEATQIIASGQLIPSEVFSAVGFMDEQLFIDWVDTEWCWRARAKGWRIYGCADVIINHTMGDNIKLLAGRAYSLRTPVRHYYIVRNALLLALYRPAISWKQRVNVLFRALRFLFGAPLFSSPHFVHLRFTFRGLIHGLINRHGKY